MQMLCKTETFCLRVADPNLIFDRICVCRLHTHMRRLIPTYLALSLKQVLNLCPIPLFPPLLSGGDM